VRRADGGEAWTEAMALFRGQRDILLTLAGAFILLPSLLLNTLFPLLPQPDADWPAQAAAFQRWIADHWFALLAATLAAALGRLAILILLLGPGRPTVGEALAAGLRLVPVFFLAGLLVNLITFAGLLLFLLPGLYLIGRTLLTETVLVAERLTNPVAPIRRAFAVSRGNGWRIFFVAAIVYVAGWILSAAINAVVGVILVLAGGTGLDAFLPALIGGVFQAGVSLLLLLVSIAFYRQLG
jgi:hypothetical protein